MKQRTDALVASDEKLQQFLMWLSQKSLSVKVPYKPAVVRAFYLALDRAFDGAFDLALNPAFDLDLDRALVRILDRALVRILDRAPVRTLDRAYDRQIVLALDLALVRALDLALMRAFNPVLDPKLKQGLQELKQQLPDPDKDEERFKQWWRTNGCAWTRQLRALMIEHRNIGHDWEFSYYHRQVLMEYYEANKLLVDCLNNNSDVTPAVRSHIEETLLLPIALIEQRGSC
jgi:predicted NACHT family NTPase